MIYKPSDAKIRRIQTPTQYSSTTHYQHHHSITQGSGGSITGNQGSHSKMRPDSYGKYFNLSK